MSEAWVSTLSPMLMRRTCPTHASLRRSRTLPLMATSSFVMSGRASSRAIKWLHPQSLIALMTIGTATYRTPEALWARIHKKPKRVFPGLPAWSVKKASKKSPRSRKRVKHVSKSVFGFLTLRARNAREDLFETLWRFRGSGIWRHLYMGI